MRPLVTEDSRHSHTRLCPSWVWMAVGYTWRLAEHRIFTATELAPRTRVAAAIVLFHAQPLSRVVRLTVDDVFHDGNQVLLRLGEPPSPVPGPVAALLLGWIDNQDNMNTATNRDSR